MDPIQCANVAIRHDEYLRSFYLRIKKRRGHNIAIVATARKMLGLHTLYVKEKGSVQPKVYTSTLNNPLGVPT